MTHGPTLIGDKGISAHSVYSSFLHAVCVLQIFSCLMAFFLSNMLETHFLSTGAFEITLNGTFKMISKCIAHCRIITLSSLHLTFYVCCFLWVSLLTLSDVKSNKHTVFDGVQWGSWIGFLLSI